MNRMLPLAALAIAAASTMGCYKATFVSPEAPKANTIERWNDFYLFGTVGEQQIDVRRYCPSEAAVVRTGGNVGTDVVTVLTLGIYAPRKLYITCAGPEPRVASAPAAAPATEVKP